MENKYVEVDFRLPKGYIPSKEFESVILNLWFPTMRLYVPEKDFGEFEKLILKVLEKENIKIEMYDALGPKSKVLKPEYYEQTRVATDKEIR